MRIEGVTSTFSSQASNNNVDVNNAENINISKKATDGENPEPSKKGEEISLSEKTIEEAIEKANKKLVLADRKFEFSINDETNDIIVRVINKETDEVIKEIPSEKILDMVAKMMELAGLFIDERR